MRVDFLLTVSVLIVDCTFTNARNFLIEECEICRTEEECNSLEVGTCEWGLTRDNCGRLTCAKGPGERCGGPRNRFGDCGEGMYCTRDERCHGCTTKAKDIICFD